MYSTTVNFIVNGLIIVFGLFGNLVVLIVFSNNAFKKFPSRNIYRILVVFDSVAVVSTVTNTFITNFGIIYQNYSLFWFMSSEILLKIYFYIQCIFQSSYLLVFISIEKFISIRYPNNK